MEDGGIGGGRKGKGGRDAPRRKKGERPFFRGRRRPRKPPRMEACGPAAVWEKDRELIDRRGFSVLFQGTGKRDHEKGVTLCPH